MNNSRRDIIHIRKERMLRKKSSSLLVKRIEILLIVSTLLLLNLSFHQVDSKFEPYTLNGGLVSAVAGRDYILIASDTRLTDGGYEILSRSHLSSRIWSATSIEIDQTTTDENAYSGFKLNTDGSVSIPDRIYSGKEEDIGRILKSSSESFETTSTVPLTTMRTPPCFVASAGCAADCEALKRQIRYELSTLSHNRWNECTFHNHFTNAKHEYENKNVIHPNTVATLLSQTLYSRRHFPFYSFCVVAGLDDHITINNARDIEDYELGLGAVYIYDAIGSYEQVSVACTGSGKEMLQPILDQLFSHSASSFGIENQNQKYNLIQRDAGAIRAVDQRVGLTKLRPPVKTYVDCDAEEAISLLLQGYRSVAEREIGVGDNVVICLVKRIGNEHPEFENCSKGKSLTSSISNIVQTFRFPLKKH
mmetsp:Transcript_20083/g.28272  ORF Transcript_20083/g.28272 Transcript_20083/m.28272 type:complete len:420 (-) Transcript_20083:68-1327(-)